MQRVARLRAQDGLSDADVSALSGGAAAAAMLGSWDKSVALVMRMALAGALHTHRGPAALITSTTLCVLACEPAAVGGLLKLGLIDQGDWRPGFGPQQGNGRRQLQRRNTLTKLDTSTGPAHWGVTSHPRGVVGVLVDTKSPGHAYAAAALIALVALAQRDTACGRDAAGAAAVAAAAHARSMRATRGLKSSKTMRGSGQPGNRGLAIAPSFHRRRAAALAWARRMLAAGAWHTMAQCLATMPTSVEMQGVVAVGLNYLAADVVACYQEVMAAWEAGKPARHAARLAKLKAEAEAAAAAQDAATEDKETAAEVSGLPHSRHPLAAQHGRLSHGATTWVQRKLVSQQTFAARKGTLLQESSQGDLGPEQLAGSSSSKRLMLHIPGEVAGGSGAGGSATLAPPIPPTAAGQSTGGEAATESGTAYEDAPDLQPVFRLLMAGVYHDLVEALSVLPQLLHGGDPTVLLFAARAVWSLAGVPLLCEPLGEAGAVEALVAGVRRSVLQGTCFALLGLITVLAPMGCRRHS